MYLFDIKSDRKESFNKVSINLFNSFKKYVDINLKLFCLYFVRFYGISSITISRKIVRRIAVLYNNKEGRHSTDLHLKNVPKYIILYIGMLIYTLIFSKIFNKQKTYDLMIYDIYTNSEYIRIKKLIEKFDEKKVIIIAKDSFQIDKKLNIVLSQNFKGYNFLIVLRSFLKEIIFGIPLYLILSLKYKINLFPLAMRIINNFMCYSSYFYLYKSKYLYMERHIKIDPLMKEIFHINDGKCLFTTQKSILAGDQTSLFYDFDLFFTLGNKSHLRAEEYGSNISKIVPLGSLFYHERIINRKLDNYNIENEQKNLDYDLLYIGGNIMNVYELYDHYDGFMQDYYETIKWLVLLKKKNPNHKIGIKHHKSAGFDQYEAQLLNNSGVDLIDKNHESYDLVKNSKVCTTYASTLGYESFLLGKRCLFLDPFMKNNFIAYHKENKVVDKYRTTNFEEFELKYNLLLKKNESFSKIDDNDLREIITYINDPYDLIFKNIINFK